MEKRDANKILQDEGTAGVEKLYAESKPFDPGNADGLNGGSRPPKRLTDLGNARRLVELHGRNIRYVHTWCQWLVWEDGHWRKDENGAVMRLAKATIEKMFEEASLINDEDV